MKRIRSLFFVIVFILVLSACAPAQQVSATQPQPVNTSQSANAPLPAPAWLSVELTEVSTGKSFTINDFKGKVVVVESMAIWCPNCLRQGQELKALRAIYGPEDLVVVTLDIDLNENAAMLSEYAKKYGFDWSFAVAPLALMRDVGNLYGALFMDPTLSPTLVVDRKGEVFKMGFGEKKADAMSKSLAPFIEAGK
jgi:thiol-disulfide isomerase/thioredoxin